MTAYKLVLISGGFLLVGALLGAWITYLFALKLAQKNHENALTLIRQKELKESATVFRSAFLPEITFLKHNANIGDIRDAGSIGNLLKSGYLRHLTAFEIFQCHLSGADREALARLWDEYCYPDSPTPQDPNERADFRFLDYITIEELKGTAAAKAIALEKTNNILEFTPFKKQS